VHPHLPVDHELPILFCRMRRCIILAQSGHEIPRDAPEAVIAAAHDIVLDRR